MGQGFDFFQNHLIPLCYFGFSAIKECCSQPNAVLSWGSGMPCRIRVSAPCVLYSLLLVMAFLPSAAAAALGGWLCREQLTLTLNSFQEHFPRHLFSFGITLIWPFVSTVTSVQSYWFRRFFSSDVLRSIFNWKHSPRCNPSRLVFPTNFPGSIFWWAPLLMQMLVNVESQHHWNILCFDSVQRELLLQLGVQPPLGILSMTGLPTLHLSNNHKWMMP